MLAKACKYSHLEQAGFRVILLVATKLCLPRDNTKYKHLVQVTTARARSPRAATRAACPRRRRRL